MAVIAVTGGPGAPGATTTALALLLCWPLAPGRKVMLVECDPDGGAALAGALEGRVEAVYGLRNLAVADRRGLLAQAIWEQLIDISPQGAGERLLLPGLTDPAQAAGLAYTWEPLVEALRALEPEGYDVLLDLGRSGALGPGAVLARRADAVVATVRTTLRGLSAARPRLAALRADLETAGTGTDALGLLLITEGPYPVADITRELGLPVLGTLPYAVRTARVLSDGGDSTDRRFVRSELMRTARTTADRIQALVAERRARLTAPAGAAPAGAGGAAAEGGLAWGAAPQPPSAAVGERVPEASQYQGFQGYEPEQAGPSERQYQQAYAPPSGQLFEPPAAEPAYQQAYQPTPQPAYQSTYRPGVAEPAFGPGQPQPAEQPVTYQPPPPAQPAPAQPAAPAAPAVQPYQQPQPQPSGVPAVREYPAPMAGGQAFTSSAGQVYVPSAGPVQVRPAAPGQQPAAPPPLAGIAPHPAAPEPFRAPTEETETQGEVLRAR
ncbi:MULTISPECIES: hypothetical protein [unclassified Kitasatospora]|uniref:hypothetical protein n=1 Tax=unclassified Kitasatospora TaxID=2633591 RepID=UPI002E13499B|nr:MULTISPECIES: hypothetical protein [unclassified Kitasatospora]